MVIENVRWLNQVQPNRPAEESSFDGYQQLKDMMFQFVKKNKQIKNEKLFLDIVNFVI